MKEKKTTKKNASDMLILPTPNEIVLDHPSPNLAKSAGGTSPKLVISLDWSAKARKGVAPSWIRYVAVQGSLRDDKCVFPIDNLFTDPSLVVVGFLLRPNTYSSPVMATLLYYTSEQDIVDACDKKPRKDLVPFDELIVNHQSMDVWGVVSTSPEIIIPEVLGLEAECQIA